jgi:hypothetical protein
MSDELMSLNDRLTRKLGGSLEKGGLDALVDARKKEQESFLLLDYSSSMDETTGGHAGRRKIDALRDIAKELKDEMPNCPQVGFGGYVGVNPFGSASMDNIRFIDEVPEPDGGTPLGEGIRFCRENGAKHIVLVSDGAPNDQQLAMQEAALFKGPIDVFYVGPDHDRDGQAFMRRLAESTKGSISVTTLRDPKQLAAKVMGLLGN